MKNRKNKEEGKLGKPQAFSFAPLPRRSPSPQQRAASPQQRKMAKMATHGFAAAKQCFAAVKTLFTWAKIFILFLKVSYSCTDSLRTLIND